MPRDWFASDSDPKDESVVASPDAATPRSESIDDSTDIGSHGDNESTIHRGMAGGHSALQLHADRENIKERNNLHPYVQTLSISNLEGCLALENAVFPEHERCSRAKFIYRLNVCPELCLGMFSTRSSPPDPSSTPIYAAAHPPDSASPHLKSVLIAMVIATKIVNPSVTDQSMDIPPNWQRLSDHGKNSHGHQENGRTIAIHSLGVLPACRGRGLAKTLMKSYEQRMETSGIADRIALLAHDHLLKMYEGMGFEVRGKSDVNFGGGGWNNLRTYEFSEHGPGS